LGPVNLLLSTEGLKNMYIAEKARAPAAQFLGATKPSSSERAHCAAVQPPAGQPPGVCTRQRAKYKREAPDAPPEMGKAVRKYITSAHRPSLLIFVAGIEEFKKKKKTTRLTIRICVYEKLTAEGFKPPSQSPPQTQLRIDEFLLSNLCR
jgi:hypothetical protein